MTDFECNFNCEERKPIEAEFIINAKNAVSTWGSITGLLSNQADLQNALNTKVNQSITINGYALNNNITLSTSDLNNDSGFISLESLSSNANGLIYDNTNGVFSLDDGYVIPLSETLDNLITKEVNDLTYYRTSANQDIIDNNLSTRISEESSFRANSDTQLDNRISTESNRREEADNTLNQKINKEIQDRTDADTFLANKIIAVESAISQETNERTDSISQERTDRIASDNALTTNINSVSSNLTSHINNTHNPHNVTKNQIGLSNVDNTSDINKPISIAVNNALNNKANISDVQDLSNQVRDITNIIPEEATNNNNLADKKFVTDSIGSGNLFLKTNNNIIGTFNANSKVDKNINIDIPQKTSDLINDSNFINFNDISSGSDSLTYNNNTGEIKVSDGYSITTSVQKNQIQINTAQIQDNVNDINNIKSLIPNQASSSNQLADKDFVNSSIQTDSASFRGNWSNWSNVPIYPNEYPEDYSQTRTPNTNDYMVVENASDYAPLYSDTTTYNQGFCVYYNNTMYKAKVYMSPAGNFDSSKWQSVTEGNYSGSWRFKYVGLWNNVGREGWRPEYRINEEPFTPSQLNAINSGITSTDVGLIHTAIQPNDNISKLVNDSEYINKNVNNLTNYMTTTNINSALSQKQNNITGGASTITSNNLTASRALIANSSGKVAVSSITISELNQLSGISSNIQSQLNNTASIDLTRLSDSGKDKLHSLKSYLDDGKILTEVDGFNNIKHYAHSTFDTNSFVKVGTPAFINGVASNFGNDLTNYIYSTQSLPLNYNTFEIYLGKFNFSDFSENDWLMSNSLTLSSTTGGIQIRTAVNSTRVAFLIWLGTGTSDGWNIASSRGSATSNYRNNNTFELKLVFTGSKYTLYVKADDNDWAEEVSIDSTSKIAGGLNFYVAPSTTPHAYSYDAKYFQIKVNGNLYSSGTKTGVDVIKKNDYTPLPTNNPITVTPDGIASGFSATKYITKSFELDTNYQTLEIDLGEIMIDSFLEGDTTMWFFQALERVGSDIAKGFWIGIYSNGRTRFFIGSGNANWDITDGSVMFGNITYSAGQRIKFKLVFDGIKYDLLSSINDGDWQIDKEIISNKKLNFNTNMKIGSDGSANCLPGSMDLNCFKIIKDSEIIYQPCLRIPYTLSSTGSKIVDSIYRNRVNDMYDQFGYAPYYTLSDIDFSMPQGEIYGLIEKAKNTAINSIVPDYTSGINISAYSTSDNQYTVPVNGFIYAEIDTYTETDTETENSAGVYIDGVQITSGKGSSGSIISTTVVVGKGSKVYVSNPSTSYSGCYFYPCKETY